MKMQNMLTLPLLVLLFAASSTPAADWPMWRYDAGRTAAGPEELPAELHPIWSRQYSARETTWDDPLNQDLMQFDRVFEPIVLGSTLYMGFNDRDKVVALDCLTGKQKWAFYTDGPVRLPLAGGQGRLYFTSDDGHLYCVSATDGRLLWKFRGGPADRKILGNKRLVSTWPARGGAVIRDGVVYFAAGIWPFMGTFIYALDAETGSVVWRNEGSGSQYIAQPHNSPSFAGVAPQGVLAIGGQRLLIPGGRSVPACLDLGTGVEQYYHLAKYNKTGGAFVCADERFFFNHFRERETDLYDLATGEIVGRKLGKYPVLSGRVFYMSGDSIVIRDASSPAKILGTVKVDASGDLIQSGSRLYAGGDGRITALKILEGGGLEVAWTQEVDGKIGRLLAANGRLFAVTLDGKIIAFAEKGAFSGALADRLAPWRPAPENSKRAGTILEQTGIEDGYALVYGAGDGDLVAALAQASDLHIIAVDPDERIVDDLRIRFDEAGLLGTRIHLLRGTPADFPSPPYLASLTVVSDVGAISGSILQKLTLSLRPYGGRLWLPIEQARQAEFVAQVGRQNDSMLSVDSARDGLTVSRNGALPGTSNWTHQYGSMANTVKSDDELVKLPLGILWFGGSSNLDVLPRHGHGPPEQIVDGRLIIQGMDGLSARDVYTGRVLWSRKLENLGTFGKFYNDTYQDTPLDTSSNQEHIPGANATGTNFVATADWIYVVQGEECLALDIADGTTRKTFTLPREDRGGDSRWGYVGVADEILIAGRGLVPFSAAQPAAEIGPEQKKSLSEKDLRKLAAFGNYDYTASKSLIFIDRHSGSVRWKIEARYGFIHNAVTVGDNRVYCLDKLPVGLEKKLARRGLPVPADYRLLAFDLQTGRLAWEKSKGVFGSWLSYSGEHGLLLQATRPSRDMLTDETGERMAVYNGEDGTLLWDREIAYENPPILHHEHIITDNAAYGLLTGERKYRQDPLAGDRIPWTYTRAYGCSYNIACENILSFRSAAAGFYDLQSEGGTGNLGGFKSGCTSNLIAANGVLNAPDYTRTCQCSYQNQTSLALIHMPELEYWTTNEMHWNGAPVKKIGINLHAPGDRMAPDGTLWLDYPSVGGQSPDIPIKHTPELAQGIRRNSLSLRQKDYPWVAASGLVGPLQMEITLSAEPVEKAAYTVKLHFAELEDRKPGERIFDVWLQDGEVLRGFDIVREAGGAQTPVVKTFTNIPVGETLKIRALPSFRDAKAMPILCGIELERVDSY